ncbi:MAG: metal-dependent hydrolase [Thermoplasmata archaeon]|nr:metal-dependent hydrolase [Thermoplasmata archaeon]
MKITWLGHAAFLVEDGGVRVLFDPFISGNPRAPVRPEDIECDLVLVTHGHGDHLGDTEAIARRTGAHVIAIHEVKEYLLARGVDAEGMNIGGSVHWKGLRVYMTNALHSSGIGGGENIAYMGHPAGFVVYFPSGRVYHMGDTGIFGDMRLIGELHHPDVVLAPIGDRFTMGPEEAALAISWLSPKLALPMHYGTFPLVDADPMAFKRLAEKDGGGTRVVVLSPGESVEYPF